MRFKHLVGCCSAIAILLTVSAPLSFGAEDATPTNPAEYQERTIRPELRKDDTEKDSQEPTRVPEEVNQLQFDQPLEQEYNEMVSALSFTGEDKSTTAAVASHIGLFHVADPLPQEAPHNENASVAWLPWVLGTVVAGLLVTLFVYILPKGFSMTEQ
ncbi:type VII secretion EssA family protein [Shouchella lonarensis]|uniref:Type VII secretion protein EssA n=1 Tax=Shouchella lonarensis TaxID=1464122 RepID=A0A1G6GY80_9BACI|nr:type VII secretion EssA family protein [Shouchella lonarensis]SDB86873.1 hypothetical protein SAMN05421737_102148 [Shouchella lonarensis]